MRRYSSPGTLAYSFTPGPMSFAVKILIWTNVVAFLVGWIVPTFNGYLGLQPYNVIGRYWVWQPVTYMVIHAGAVHLLMNMLVLWWFGVELERLWGTTFFVKFYFVSGIAGAALTLLVAILPVPFGAGLLVSTIVGASGAIFGLLLAYAMYFPDRPIYLYFLFPVPAKYFVMIVAALSLFTSGTAWTAHLGGLAGGYVFLKFGRARPLAELKYRYFKWKMNRLRRKFDIYHGGKEKDWDRRLH
jgi:membrane associated rhomboid family serine protease